MSKKIISRKLWVDIFKFLAIILVVIGHATGEFNKYIYQFHMAAFFAVSGFCTDFYKNSKLELIWKRFYSLIFPLVTIFLMGTLGMFFLNKFGLYNIFFSGELPYVGVLTMIKEFFLYSNNYVWWMGTCWFLIILFLIILLQCLITKVIDIRKKKNLILYFLIIIGLYVLGYLLLDSNLNANVLKVLIGQFFFSIGVIFRYLSTDVDINVKNIFKFLLLLIISIFIIDYLSKLPNITVDYPELKFNNIFLNTISGLNGIILLFSISKIIEYFLIKFDLKYIKTAIEKIGSSTISIVFFHFLFFKFASYILYLFDKVSFSYISNFIPNIDNIGYKYLWLYMLVFICGSVCLWDILKKIKFFDILLGVNKKFSDNMINFIQKFKLNNLFKN